MSLEIPRHDRIGGSDAAAIFGRDTYRSRLDVFREKVLELDKDLSENPHVQRGELMDKEIRKWVHKYMDDSIALSGDVDMIHPDYDFIGGHADAVGEDFLYEFKAPTMRKLQHIHDYGVPDNWMFQIQHYLWITGLPLAKLLIWDWDRWMPDEYQVKANPALHEAMEREYVAFWEDVSYSKGLPESEWRITAPPELQHEILPISSPEFDALLSEYRDATERRYSGKEDQTALKGKILTYLQGREALITDNWNVRCSLVNGRSFSYHRLTVSERS